MMWCEQGMVCTMKMMHTISNEERRPLRRSYSLQLKLEVVGQCQQPGASIAAIALLHGINANIVHRWLREHARGELAAGALRPASSEGFVPVRLEPSSLGLSPGAAEPDIRVEIRRGANAVTVSWPLQGASACAAWLREWLR
jgi:transposase